MTTTHNTLKSVDGSGAAVPVKVVIVGGTAGMLLDGLMFPAGAQRTSARSLMTVRYISALPTCTVVLREGGR